MIFVDTSVLVDFFKGRETPGALRLEQLERDAVPFAIPAVCCQELLQGARDKREWNLLLGHLDSQRILVPRDAWATHLAAARIYFDCRQRGITIRSTLDCLIAQLVLEQDGILLHGDRDFERIARVRHLRTLQD